VACARRGVFDLNLPLTFFTCHLAGQPDTTRGPVIVCHDKIESKHVTCYQRRPKGTRFWFAGSGRLAFTVFFCRRKRAVIHVAFTRALVATSISLREHTPRDATSAGE
ncbi:hypothetical protein LSAT2_010030, partial [Lamellibrachia satsuma]